MPLLSTVRFLLTLISLAILIGAAFLLWTWYQGHRLVATDGTVTFFRDGWPLWVGLALLAWSFLGRLFLPMVLAQRDRSEPTRPVRSPGTLISGAGAHKLYIEELGPARAMPIVLVHGAGMDSTIWNYAKRHLSENHRVVAWDLPGLGKSQAGDHISIDNYAADLRVVLAHVGRPAVVVGHSMGGMIIQELARNDPEYFQQAVIGAVLVNTTYTNPLKTMIMPRLAQAIRWPLLEPLMRLQIWVQPLVWLASWQSYFSGSAHMSMRVGFGPDVTRSQLNHATLLSARNPPASLAKGNLAMFRWDATGAFAKLNVPVLVLGGTIDIVTKEEAGRVIAGTALRGTFEIMARSNHMGFLEHHEAYNDQISRFAASVQGLHSMAQPAVPRP